MFRIIAQEAPATKAETLKTETTYKAAVEAAKQAVDFFKGNQIFDFSILIKDSNNDVVWQYQQVRTR